MRFSSTCLIWPASPIIHTGPTHSCMRRTPRSSAGPDICVTTACIVEQMSIRAYLDWGAPACAESSVGSAALKLAVDFLCKPKYPAPTCHGSAKPAQLNVGAPALEGGINGSERCRLLYE